MYGEGGEELVRGNHIRGMCADARSTVHNNLVIISVEELQRRILKRSRIENARTSFPESCTNIAAVFIVKTSRDLEEICLLPKTIGLLRNQIN